MLVNCVAYEDGRKLADIPVEAISDYLARPECFVWVALKDPSIDELRQMQEEFDLHPLAVEDARSGHQRPKLEEYGETVFSVVHILEMVDGDIHVGEVDIFVGRRFVLSVRHHSQHDLSGVRRRCEREPDLLKQGSGFVFYAIMDAVVDRYFPLLDAIETELEEVEAHIFERGKARENIRRLYALKNKAVTLRHAVMPLAEAAAKLHGGRVPPVCAHSQDYFRDVHDHLSRIVLAIDGVRDTIVTAIQVNLSTVTIEESEVTKQLAAWAAIFAASTTLVGIWGMNFQHMPELKWEYGYYMALGVIGAVMVGLFVYFKRVRWL